MGRSNDERRIMLEHDGRTMSLAEWARETGIDRKTLWSRLRRVGMTTAEALTTPVCAEMGPGNRWSRRRGTPAS